MVSGMLWYNLLGKFSMDCIENGVRGMLWYNLLGKFSMDSNFVSQTRRSAYHHIKKKGYCPRSIQDLAHRYYNCDNIANVDTTCANKDFFLPISEMQNKERSEVAKVERESSKSRLPAL
jgi:hypothetical protein